MKERPILFTPENAQKVHVGTKTQTRRIVKPQPNVVHGWNGRYLETNQIFRNGQPGLLCPYGVVGDHLWCREPYRFGANWDIAKPSDVPVGTDLTYIGADEEGFWGKRRAAFHLPRWACRTVLELTGVRVERLNSISEEDAMAEGAECTHVCGISEFDQCFMSIVDHFAELWESIHGPGSWDANPFCWVLEFKRVTHG